MAGAGRCTTLFHPPPSSLHHTAVNPAPSCPALPCAARPALPYPPLSSPVISTCRLPAALLPGLAPTASCRCQAAQTACLHQGQQGQQEEQQRSYSNSRPLVGQQRASEGSGRGEASKSSNVPRSQVRPRQLACERCGSMPRQENWLGSSIAQCPSQVHLGSGRDATGNQLNSPAAGPGTQLPTAVRRA